MHRDLKPANILITSNSEVKICDFGISRSLEELDEKSGDCTSSVYEGRFKQDNLSKNKNARDLTPHVGSRWYRAPEIILTQKNYDYKSDMFSVGCMLGELLRMKKEKITTKGKLVLFKGSSCYPMSPCKEAKETN